MTRARLFGAVVGGTCLWLMIVGCYLAITAVNGFPGVLLITLGALGVASIVEWLWKDGGS